MQFHVDGFRPGDPDVHPAAPGLRRARRGAARHRGRAGRRHRARRPVPGGAIGARAADPHAGRGPASRPDGKGPGRRHQRALDGDVPGLRFCPQGDARVGVDQRDHVLGARRTGAAGPRGARAGRARRHLRDAARADQPGARARHVPRPDAVRADPARARLRPEGGGPVGRCRGHRSPGDRDAGAHHARPRGAAGHRARQLRGGLRRRALCRARRHRRRAARGRGAPGLGRDGRAGHNRLPGLAHEVVRALAGRRHPDGAAARGRAPGAPVCRAGPAGRTRARRRPRHGRGRHRGQGAAHPAALRARREGGGVVVDLRDRPPPDRQVRRRAARPGGRARAARDAGRRRLPHPQPQGRPGHERVDGRHLQPGLEAGVGADRPRRRVAAAQLFRRAARRRQGAGGVRPPMGARRRRHGPAPTWPSTRPPPACRWSHAPSSTTCPSPAA